MRISESGLCLSFQWRDPLSPCVRREWMGGKRGHLSRQAKEARTFAALPVGERGVPFFRCPKFKYSRCTCPMRGTGDPEIVRGRRFHSEGGAHVSLGQRLPN